MVEALIIGIIALVVACVACIMATLVLFRKQVATVDVATNEYPAAQSIDEIDGLKLTDGLRVLVMDGPQRGIYNIQNENLHEDIIEKVMPRPMIFVKSGRTYNNTYVSALDIGDDEIAYRPLVEQVLGRAPKNVSVLAHDENHFRWIHQPQIKAKIPNVIHQVYGLWDDTPLPQTFVENRTMWRNSVHYEMRLWTKESCEKLVKKHRLEHVWRNLKRKCQRADLIRYLILYEFGGWYFDLDCIPTHLRLDTCKYSHDVVLFTEAILTDDEIAKQDEPIRHGVPEHRIRIANFAMGTCAKHAFWHDVLGMLQERCANNEVERDYDVIYTTGPDVMTTVYHEHSWPDIQLFDEKQSRDIVQHLCTGTWRHSQDV